MTGKVESEIENSELSVYKARYLKTRKLLTSLKERKSVANNVREIPDMRMRRRKKLEKE